MPAMNMNAVREVLNAGVNHLTGSVSVAADDLVIPITRTRRAPR